MSDEMSEGIEEMEDDFEPEMEEDLDADLDDIDEDLDEEEEEEEAYPAPVKKKKDDYSDSEAVEIAVKANPKRMKARKKSQTVIGGIVQAADLEKPDGQLKAFNKMQEQTDLTLAKPYAVHATFEDNDVIEHPSFGVGFVIEQLTDTKVAVLFEEGLKKLVCNLKR
ncbi:MAG: hypothetical protein AAGI01_08855 [Myxococcota bacterium]